MYIVAKKKLIISFLPFGWGGAGDHIAQLSKELVPDIILVPRIFFKYKILNKLMIICQSLIIVLKATYLLRRYDCETTINHPQTLGYNFANYLIKNSSKINYHVVDTHFFCIKSYNVYGGKNCLNCLEGRAILSGCGHFPRKQSHSKYIKFQTTIEKHRDKINFFCQTDKYKDLLFTKYGNDVTVTVKKMFTFELMKMAESQENNTISPRRETYTKKYDLGFHGAFIPAKGSDYLIELSTVLSSSHFLVPEPGIHQNKNIHFVPYNWNTGLREALSECRIIICPSIWSAPVEGSILKSMLDAHPVALLPQNTFTREIPDNCVIKLTGQVGKDAALLRKLIDDQKTLDQIGTMGKAFAQRYLDNNEIKN